VTDCLDCDMMDYPAHCQELHQRAEAAERQVSLVADSQKWLSWALDLLDMYDERLVALGDPKELVYSEIHVTGKAEARRVLARGEGDRK